MKRRAFVAGTVGVGMMTLAGCQGDSDGQPTIDCSTAVREASDGLIQSASVSTLRPENDGPIAQLELLLTGDAVPDGPQEDRLGRVEITNSRDDLLFEIPIEEPTSVQRSYAVAIGPQPQHGQYHLTLQVDGETVDEMELDFTCRYRE